MSPPVHGEDVAFASIRELSTHFQARNLSPVEVTQALLARIERLDPKIRSFVTVTADVALAEARAAEAAFLRGDRDRPLLGIPVAYKDIIATAGVPTTAGSDVLADWVPESDATVVTQLRRAGAVSLGKLIPHEFAFGIQFPGHRFPPARNPWNLDHMPGGSSSGSGAALAAGLTAGALGTDTGGSIRLPAAFSGISGLKPTYGRVSRAGILPLAWTLDHAGPMARSVEDCAYLLQALAGHDPADPTSSRAPVPDYVAALTRDIRGLRIGVPRAYFLEDLDPDMAAAFAHALTVLEKLGAVIRTVEIPSIEAASAGLLIMLVEAFAYHEPNLRATPERYGEVLREKFLAGALFTGAEYVQAQRLRNRLCAEIDELFKTVDVLATPTARGPATAFAVVLDPTFGFPRYNTLPFNLTGQPALAVPCGFSRIGLPLSLQLVGRPLDEETVLRVGDAYQVATDWLRRRPAL